MSPRIREPESVHLRRVNKHGGVVLLCNNAPVRDGSRLRTANFPDKANCPRCLAKVRERATA